LTRCPTELELEAYLLDPSRSSLPSHLAGCASCSEQVAEMRRVGDEFLREVFPRTVDAVVARSRRRWLPRWFLAAAPLSAAAAVAAALLVVAGPPPGYVGPKGGDLGLAVFVNGVGGARPAHDGEPLPARAEIRFRVTPARACRLWVLSVDGAGQVSRLYPASGDAAADVEASTALPGGAVLDGRAGPERIFAVCSLASLPYSEVERAARTAGAGGEGAVRSARALPGLPRDAAQATVLLEKRP
jgi:hypothetical protein